MGGLNKRNSNVVFVNLKEGKLYESTDKDKTNPFDDLTGIVTSMSFRNDEFEGKKIRKFSITVTAGETDYVLGMKVDSSYFSTLISFLKNADFSKELSLVPFFKKEKDGKSSLGILVNQGGWLKHFYTKDNPNGLPAFDKVRINGEVKYDKTNYMAFLEEVVEKELKPNLGKAVAVQDTKGLRSSVESQERPEHIHSAVEEVADDLPF